MLTTSASPQTAPTTPTQSERFHALDAIRAFALIIGIFFHGVLSFVSYIPPQAWAIRDSQRSVFLDSFFFVAHSFRMQAFFLIAGYFAHLLYHRQGPKGFLTHRIKRILVPFVLFLPIMYASVVVLWVWGYQIMGVIPKESPIAQLSPWLVMIEDIMRLNWFRSDVPITHLWFLYYLMLFCLTAFPVRPFINRIDDTTQILKKVDSIMAMIARSWWGGFALGAVVILPMQIVKGWGSLDAPDHGFIPLLAPFLVYGIYFTIGWLFQRQPALLTELRRYWKLNLLISLGLMGGLTAFFLTNFYANSSSTNTIGKNGIPPFTNSIYGAGSMTSVFAFIGVILHYFSHPSKRIRYLSDSAYWLYIAHLPVVVFFQILVAPLQIHWLLKMPLIFVPSFAILFLTYHYGVRNTWLGVLLNGRRYPLK